MVVAALVSFNPKNFRTKHKLMLEHLHRVVSTQQIRIDPITASQLPCVGGIKLAWAAPIPVAAIEEVDSQLPFCIFLLLFFVISNIAQL
jgi:hypothetical protein